MMNPLKPKSSSKSRSDRRSLSPSHVGVEPLDGRTAPLLKLLNISIRRYGLKGNPLPLLEFFLFI